jgi:hypothetical protein
MTPSLAVMHHSQKQKDPEGKGSSAVERPDRAPRHAVCPRHTLDSLLQDPNIEEKIMKI